MTSEEIWRQKTDAEVAAAAARASEYTELGQQIIEAEIQRRGLTGGGVSDEHQPSDAANARTARLDVPPLLIWHERESATVQVAAPRAPRGTRFNNVVARHWRGDLSLPVSYWLIGLLGNVAISIFTLSVSRAFSTDAYNPSVLFGLLITIWCGALVITVWQIVGLWRSANHYADERSRLNKGSGWGAMAKLAAILGVMRVIGTCATIAYPQIAEVSRIALMDDPDIPPFSFRIMRNGTEAEITGGIKYGLTAEFSKLLKAAPQVRVVHLNSNGGRIGEAIALNGIINEKRLITYVSSECLSACTVAFAGGRERWLGADAALGFHGPSFPGWSQSDLAESVEDQRQLFLKAGFNAEFVTRALAVPSEDMWRPSRAELKAAGAITNISDGRQFAISGYGAELTRESLATHLSASSRILSTLREKSPGEYATVVDAFVDDYMGGQTEGDVVTATQDRLAAIVERWRPLADDAVVRDLWQLTIDQLRVLEKNPALCYSFASGSGGNHDFSKDLPAALLQRERVLQERIIATGAARPAMPDTLTSLLWQEVFAILKNRLSLTERIALIDPNPDVSQYADYCSSRIAVIAEVMNLPRSDSALLLRSMLSDDEAAGAVRRGGPEQLASLEPEECRRPPTVGTLDWNRMSADQRWAACEETKSER